MSATSTTTEQAVAEGKTRVLASCCLAVAVRGDAFRPVGNLQATGHATTVVALKAEDAQPRLQQEASRSHILLLRSLRQLGATASGDSGLSAISLHLFVYPHPSIYAPSSLRELYSDFDPGVHLLERASGAVVAETHKWWQILLKQWSSQCRAALDMTCCFSNLCSLGRGSSWNGQTRNLVFWLPFASPATCV